MAKKRIDVEIGVKNKIAAGLKTIRRSIQKFARGVSGAMRSIGVSFKRVAMVGIGAFVGLIKYGNSFRASMAEVKTMLGDDKSMLPELTKQVRALSAEFGFAKKTLADGLYQALSAGIPAGNAIDFLTVASKAAVGGVTDVATAVDGLTSVINAYGIDAARVSNVSDLMFTVVKEGKINFEELSQNIGNIAPFAKVAGVGIEELSAMIATLVKVDKPERAMTSLRQAMVFAAKEGKPLLQVLNEFEGKSLEDMLAAGVTQKSAAGIAIMSSNMAVLRKEMAIFSDTAGAANDAFEDVNAVRGWQRLWQTILSITSVVGEKIDSVLMPAINNVSAAIQRMGESETFDYFIKKVENVTEIIAGLISVLASGDVASKMQALSSIGEIIKLGFISGAQQAANLMNIGLHKAWDAFHDKAIKGFATYAEMLVNPFKAADKLGEWLGKASVGGEKAVKDIFDVEGTNVKLEAAIESLKDQLNAPPPPVVVVDPGKTKTPTKNGKNNVIPPPVVSASTSMLSTGDLFTMMQTGSDSKATMVSEQQKTNALLEEQNKIIGGAK